MKRSLYWRIAVCCWLSLTCWTLPARAVSAVDHTQISNNYFDDRTPQITNTGLVIWNGMDPVQYDTEIFVYDTATGTSSILSGNNTANDYYPSISPGSNVVWSRWDNFNFDIYLSNGTNSTKITQSPYNDIFPKVNDLGQVVWQGDDGKDYEIFLYNSDTGIKQITDNKGIDKNPQLNSTGQIVWEGWDGKDWEIYSWADNTIWQLTDNLYNDALPQLNNQGQVAWYGWDGFDYEIYYWDGSLTSQLTSNDYDDLAPRLNNNGQIVWSGNELHDDEIFYWDGASTFQITDNLFSDNAPVINDDNYIAWHGWDGTDWEIYYAHAVGGQPVAIQLTHNSLTDRNPALDQKDQVVWEMNDGIDNEIMMGTLDKDSDGDGVIDQIDNCPSIPNADQLDSDGDGSGNLCDICPYDAKNDADADGFCANLDNCPTVANPDQTDTDNDGSGNVCDRCPLDAANDADADGFCANLDNCPAIANPDQTDTDGDGSGDACDPCPTDSLNDADGDGLCASLDNCPTVANPDQIDTDADGSGDLCDACPLDALNDADVDGFCANLDNCPNIANPDQIDTDGDGSGDLCDNDADNDGHPSGADCNDFDNTKYQNLNGYADVDQDGYGAGAQVAVCSGVALPTTHVVNNTDCDDTNAAKYQTLNGYVDADLDGYGAGAQVAVCSGVALPTTHVANNTDCDDTNAAKYQTLNGYVDADLDGYGAGAQVAVCSGAALPHTHVANNTDCNDADNTKYQNINGYADLDQDGYGAGAQVAVCSGAALPHTHVANNTDCDYTSAAIYQNLPGYADPDSDGIGSGTQLSLCSGAVLPAGNVATGGDNCPNIANPDQIDTDGDGIGDLCDNDADNDGHPSGADCNDADNTKYQNINGYADLDQDGYGAGARIAVCSGTALPRTHVTNNTDCEDTNAAKYQTLLGYNDPDADGIGSGNQVSICSGTALDAGYAANGGDNCPNIANADQVDSDGDGSGDLCDFCPLDADNDADADGFCANLDTCPLDFNPDQTDSDGDGFGDLCDVCTDTDGDGFNLDGGECGPLDCDDTDITISPEASDSTVDGIDQNCDGIDGAADRFAFFPAIKDGPQRDGQWLNYLSIRAKDPSQPVMVTFFLYNSDGSLRFMNTETIPVNGSLVKTPNWMMHQVLNAESFSGTIIAEADQSIMAMINTIAPNSEAYDSSPSAPPQTSLFFPSAYDNAPYGNGYSNVLHLQNPFGRTATIQVEYIDDIAGTTVDQTEIPPYGEYEKKVRQVVRRNFNGSIKVTADIPVAGMLRYEYQQSYRVEATTIYEPTKNTQKIFFPYIYDGFGGNANYYSVMNTSNAPRTCSFEYYLPEGATGNGPEYTDGPITIWPGNRYVMTPSWARYDSLGHDFAGSITGTCDGEVTAMTNVIWPKVEGYDNYESVTPLSTMVFPQVYDNQNGYVNDVRLQNPGALPIEATLDLYYLDGTLLGSETLTIGPFATAAIRPYTLNMLSNTLPTNGSLQVSIADGGVATGVIVTSKSTFLDVSAAVAQ